MADRSSSAAERPESSRFDPKVLEGFWQDPESTRLKHLLPVREALQALSAEPAELYDLLFYGAFANKMLTVMRREGKDTEGFTRMQQSFADAVERMRKVLHTAGRLGFGRAGQYTELTQSGMSHLLDLAGDLAIVKAWQNRHGAEGASAAGASGGR